MEDCVSEVCGGNNGVCEFGVFEGPHLDMGDSGLAHVGWEGRVWVRRAVVGKEPVTDHGYFGGVAVGCVEGWFGGVGWHVCKDWGE